VEGDSCEIGPWVVRPPGTEVARNLLHVLVAATGVDEIALSGPAPNQELLSFVSQVGLTQAFRTLRMWWGENAFSGNPAGTWALAGLEKG
ncbi:MAG TPA: hypothetical protein VJP06_01725, partial [Thermoplasmata archaeon]|nr:hypothetical protein [Thermoplasmata archaeon]